MVATSPCGGLEKITDMPFDISEGLRRFVARLNEEGPNRYFEYPAVLLGDELLKLDRTVWCLRRYCYWMRGAIRTPTREIDRLPHEIERAHFCTAANAHRFRVPGGHLESILARRKDPRREAFVWKNFFYGSRKKRVVKRYTKRGWTANPAHYLDPEIYQDLRARVQFSKAVQQVFSANRNVKPA